MGVTYHVQLIGPPAARSRVAPLAGQAVVDSLVRAWRDLYPSVNVSMIHAAEHPPPAEVSLIHCAFDAPIYRTLLYALRAASKVVLGIMELDPPYPAMLAMDRFYYFGFKRFPPHKNLVWIPPPFEPDEYPPYPDVQVGGRNRILLDHTPHCYPVIEKSEGANWTSEIWEALGSLSGWEISQLERNDAGMHPAWIKLVPQLQPVAYLQEMAKHDIFIVTHSGSFNHSAKDAAILGMKVIVPKINGKCYVPQAVAERLGMIIVTNKEELLAALTAPFDHRRRTAECITYRELVEKIHHDITGLL